MGAVYTRRGSRSCPSGTSTLYNGFIANDYYTHRGSGYNSLCMHPSPQWPSGYSNGNQNDALLYTTEMETSGHSSGDEAQYGHNRELSCAVCSGQAGCTVNQKCPAGQVRTGSCAGIVNNY